MSKENWTIIVGVVFIIVGAYAYFHNEQLAGSAVVLIGVVIGAIGILSSLRPRRR